MLRWWRIGIVYERDGDPFTWTFHVRARTRNTAARLVADHLDYPHAVHVCHPSEPLPGIMRTEEIVAHYGPYRRSWQDPTVRPLRALL